MKSKAENRRTKSPARRWVSRLFTKTCFWKLAREKRREGWMDGDRERRSEESERVR